MTSDWIEILPTPLSLPAAAKRIGAGDAGGIAIFLGVTRAEKNALGQELVCLDYEAYAEMALSQMRQLALRARQQWPIVSQAILHRIGQVGVTEASVLIAVACPHRSEAFDACHFLIDKLKAEVTIWKKEVWSDGRSTWVHPNHV